MVARHTRDLSASFEPEQPALLTAVWRYPWTIALFVTIFALLALFVDRITPPQYAATTGLILEDSRATSEFEVMAAARPSNQASERYLSDQVEIIRSSVAAERASSNLDGLYTPTQILERRTVEGEAASNLIQITFTSSDPERAKQGADALAEAYADLQREKTRATADAAIAQLDELILGVETDLAALKVDIDRELVADPAALEAGRQFEALITELSRLRSERDAAPAGSVARADLNAQIAEALQDFQTYEVVLRTDRANPELDTLLQQQNALIASLVDLQSRKNAIEVNANVAEAGVNLFSPALVPEDPQGPSTTILLIASAILGLGTAIAVSYYLAIKTRTVMDPATPESVLDSPLLAQVPRFDLEGIRDSLPGVTAPASGAAEAFRFASTAIDIRASDGIRSILFVAARAGIGTTSVVANTAHAAASSGLLVLAVDSDFGSQTLTSLLGGSKTRGITETVGGSSSLKDALQTVTMEGGASLALLARGQMEVDAPALLRTSGAERFFASLGDTFDLVLVDAPALSEVAYTTTLCRYVDTVVVVVDHGSDMGELEQMADRLELIGTPILGYIYTKSPWLGRRRRRVRKWAKAFRTSPVESEPAPEAVAIPAGTIVRS